MELNRDFSEFIVSCAAHDVRVMIVGGYAVAAHGYPRFTKDLDIRVWIDEQNAHRLVAALEDFGFGSPGPHTSRFSRGGHSRPARLPAPADRHHTQVDGVEFGPCWDRHIEIEISGRRVPFISVDDLLANKKASGRPQDLADVATVEELPHARRAADPLTRSHEHRVLDRTSRPATVVLSVTLDPHLRAVRSGRWLRDCEAPR